jgi:pimeloyl-ACP methyl ester carboxylesterase
MSREREMEVGAALGEVREVSLGQGSVRYRDVGRREPILFVHGVLVNCELWRDVVVRLSGRRTPRPRLGFEQLTRGIHEAGWG